MFRPLACLFAVLWSATACSPLPRQGKSRRILEYTESVPLESQRPVMRPIGIHQTETGTGLVVDIAFQRVSERTAQSVALLQKSLYWHPGDFVEIIGPDGMPIDLPSRRPPSLGSPPFLADGTIVCDERSTYTVLVVATVKRLWVRPGIYRIRIRNEDQLSDRFRQRLDEPVLIDTDWLEAEVWRGEVVE